MKKCSKATFSIPWITPASVWIKITFKQNLMNLTDGGKQSFVFYWYIWTILVFSKAWDLCKLCLESWEIWRKVISFKKNNSCQCEEHVHERGYAKSLLGFKVFLQCTRDLRQTRLKEWPYLLKLAPTLNKHCTWDKKVITATKSHGFWCHSPIIVKIKRH